MRVGKPSAIRLYRNMNASGNLEEPRKSVTKKNCSFNERQLVKKKIRKNGLHLLDWKVDRL